MNSAANYRFLPRVELADILEDWIDYARWRSRTSGTLRVAGVMEGEDVSPDCEDHAMMIVTAHLSKRILQQGRAHSTFAVLWG